MKTQAGTLLKNPLSEQCFQPRGADQSPPLAAANRPSPGFRSEGHGRSSARPSPFIESILVPTSFSPSETKIVEHAVALARVFKAKLTLLHVVDINDPRWAKYSGDSASFRQQVWAEARGKMDHLVASLADESIEVGALLVEGLPPEEIAKRTHDFDLVIMGQPQTQPFWRLFSRKTAQRAMEEAECGILAVRE